MSYYKESSEFQPITVTRDGVVVTTNIFTAITALGSRPSAWISAVTLSGKVGFMVQGLTAGMWQVWIQIQEGPETPVLNAGTIQIL